MNGSPDHDWNDPRGFLSALETASWGDQDPLCRHCRPNVRLIPGPGTAWDLNLTHQAGCPDNPDRLPAAGLHEDRDGHITYREEPL